MSLTTRPLSINSPINNRSYQPDRCIKKKSNKQLKNKNFQRQNKNLLKKGNRLKKLF